MNIEPGQLLSNGQGGDWVVLWVHNEGTPDCIVTLVATVPDGWGEAFTLTVEQLRLFFAFNNIRRVTDHPAHKKAGAVPNPASAHGMDRRARQTRANRESRPSAWVMVPPERPGD